MNRTLILATIAALATAFVAIHSANDRGAQAQAIATKPAIDRTNAPDILPPLRFVSEHGQAGSDRALTDF